MVPTIRHFPADKKRRRWGWILTAFLLGGILSIATTHENYSHHWHTPPEWIEWVEATIGKGYYDPCPHDWTPGDASGLDDYPYPRSFYANHPGSRGSTGLWWPKFVSELGPEHGIWCAFNDEQLRHMYPSPYHLRGWLVMPRECLGFIWGGPDIIVNKKAVEGGAEPLWRRHGDRCKSPGNWTIFWTSAKPAETPSECVIVPTGDHGEIEEAREWAKRWKRRALAAKRGQLVL